MQSAIGNQSIGDLVWPPLPDYGYFTRWPQEGQSWIHPDDVPLVTRIIPSERVFKRVSFDGSYYHYQYGALRFRLRPAMWLRVAAEGFDIGDVVETVGIGLEQELFIAEIVGMYYVPRKGCLAYRLKRSGRLMPGIFLSKQMRSVKDKATVRPGETIHPVPTWNGAGKRVSMDASDTDETEAGDALGR